MKLKFLVMILFIPGLLFSQSIRKKVADGNKLFIEEKYDEATNKYRDALIDDPESPQIQFNIGNAEYKKKKYEEAFTNYQKSLSTDDIMLQSQSYYNMGNTFYRMGKLPESILAYTQSLKYNPDDLDAKYNLEFVRKKLKDQANKQQSDNQQQQQQQQQQQNENEQQQDENKQEQQQEEQNEQQQEQQSQQSEQEQKMSEEDAKRILDALKDDEKDLQKEKQPKATGNVRVLKDW